MITAQIAILQKLSTGAARAALKSISILCALLLSVCVCRGQAWEQPFEVSASLNDVRDRAATVLLTFKVPEGHYLYRDQLKVEWGEGVEVLSADVPPGVEHVDKFSETVRQVFQEDFTASYRVVTSGAGVAFKVHFQGCDEATCFFPGTVDFNLGPGAEPGKPGVAGSEDAADPGNTDLLRDFVIVGSQGGYLEPGELMAFLDDPEGHGAGKGVEFLRKSSVWISIVVILLWGLALNLTPCVLPMIPVNLAIIGAGSRAESRLSGFMAGLAYGLGMALAYGSLGLLVVLTGAGFGALNSSPWFNFVVAVVFVVMALGMFDVISIDLSKFQARGMPSLPGGMRLIGIFLLGVVSALLAGACVAPAVISVLLFSADLFMRGIGVGLLLPFLLGIGMALPWPIAAAGFVFLPKPGIWMVRVKHLFGVIIVCFAAYYAYTGYSLFADRLPSESAGVTEAMAENAGGNVYASLDRGLASAREQGTPVFIDFWASWCKNCLAMETTTFRDEAVKERLKDFTVIKYRAEDTSDAEVARVLNHFGVKGLPTYVVLKQEEMPHDAGAGSE